MRKQRVFLFIWLCFAFGVSGALAADPEEASLTEIRTYALDIERVLRKTEPSDEEIVDEISTLTRFRSAITRCVQSTKNSLDEKTAQIQSIENNVEELDAKLQRDTERALLESKKEQADATKKLVDCQLLEQRVGDLIKTLTDIQNRRLISEMQFKEKDGFTTAMEVVGNPAKYLREVYIQTLSVLKRLKSLRGDLVKLIPALLIGIMGAIWYRSRLNTRIASYDTTVQKINFSEAYTRVSERYAMWAVPLLSISIFLLFSEYNHANFSNLSQLIFILTGYVLSLALISFLLAPREGYARILTLRRQLAIPMTRSLRSLVTLSTVGGIFYLFLREQEISAEIVEAAQLGAITLFCINALIFLFMLSRARVITQFSRFVCHLISALFVVALISAWLGYRNFCQYILFGALGTSLAGFILWLLGQFTREVFDGLDLGTRRWHQAFRKRLAIRDGEHVPGLIWFRLIAIGFVWSLVVIILLRGWGLSVTGFVLLRRYFFDGFQIGDFTVVPLKIAVGILFFGTILLLSRVVKSRLSSQSMLLSRLEPSARETLVTLTGYMGFLVALLIGLSLAGISFQNFAIVAGALSVGIGFGLQNIVNNFVSGIILLFERPIRRGDWVVVGGTEGFVKNIRVRSTEIETWDRSDVVVPNSEFISSQVTNWTLSNAFGRVIVEVGVAYGTDTQKVKDILLGIAEKHPLVIQKNNFFQVPEPVVLFQAFGSSSLDFELRCFVRDVRKRYVIRSEINFEIDRLFRENDIEIPFPQRDIHIRSDNTK
ncbi:MAG: mechanosensitive ion channel domain-containing protein [Pseudomonadota bacterium]